MKRLLALLFICLSLTSTTQAALWTGILDPSRATNWDTTGVPGGIPDRTVICSTVTRAAGGGSAGFPVSASTINAALVACNNLGGGVVMLEAGTYYLNSGVDFVGASNVTLRGQGASQTTIELASSFSGTIGVSVSDLSWARATPCYINSSDASTVQNISNWTAGYSAGTTNLTLSTVTGSVTASPHSDLQPGMLLFLDQLNSPVTDFTAYKPFVTASATYVESAGCNEQRPDRCVGEAHKVIAITGTGPYTVTISPPLAYPGWNDAGTNNPKAFWCGKPPETPNIDGQGVAYRDGVEHLTITNNTGAGITVLGFFGALESWGKGIRIINGSTFNFLEIKLSANIELRDSYLYHNVSPSTCNSGANYTVDIAFAGFVKIENNILQQTCGAVLAQPCFVCVFGYNYHVGGYSSQNLGVDMVYSALPGHVGGTHLLLYEGNDFNGLNLDHKGAHGTNAMFVTSFRNLYSGQLTTGSTARSYPVYHQGYNRFGSYIGNVLGTPSHASWFYESVPGAQHDQAMYTIGFGCANVTGVCGIADDSITVSSNMRWGNYDYVTGTSRFVGAEVAPGSSGAFPQAVPASQTLPASFYLSAKPAWFGLVAWPPIGPDVTGGYDSSGHVSSIPARNCYLNVMSGPSNGSGTVLSFNATSCYTTDAVAPAPPTGLLLQ